MPPTAPINGLIPSKSDGTVDVDSSVPAAVAVSTVTPPADENGKSQQSSDESQNPQSLPSPPPEVFTRESGEHGRGDETVNGQAAGPSFPPTLHNSNSRDQLTSSRPESRQQAHSTTVPPPDKPRAAPIVQHQQNAEAGPSRPVPRAPHRPSKTAITKKRNATRQKGKEKRRLKQLEKAGKLLPQPRADAAGSDSDEEYWMAGDEIPDHLLVAAAEQGEMGKAWSDRGSATPVPEPLRRPPSPAKQSDIRISPPSPPPPPPPPPAVHPRSPSPPHQHPASPANSQPSLPNSQNQSSTEEDRIDPVESLKRGCPASFVGVHSRYLSRVPDGAFILSC